MIFGNNDIQMKNKIAFSLAGVLLIAFWALAQNPQTQNQTKILALRGALLIDRTGRPPVANSVVLISNGTIQASAPRAP